MISSTRTVRKRDGREVPFDQGKIADAIYRAADSSGGGDRFLAEELASVVALFIDREWVDRIPSIDDVSDLIEKVLVETGHAGTAKAFILERDRRERIRSSLRVRREEKAPAERGDLTVDARAHATVSVWSKGKIIEALVVEAELPLELAGEIAGEVERRVFASGLTRVSTTLIRALVENALFERGHERVFSRQMTIGLPRYDLDRLVRGGTTGGRLPGCADALDRKVAESSWTQYSLLSVYPPEVADAHCAGRLHLGALGSPTRYQTLEVDLAAKPAAAGHGFELLRVFLRRAAELTAEQVVLRGVEYQAIGALAALRREDCGPGADLARLAASLLLSLCQPEELPPERPDCRLSFPLRPSAAWLEQMGRAGVPAADAARRYRLWLEALVLESGRLSEGMGLGGAQGVRVPPLLLSISGGAGVPAEELELLQLAVLAEASGRVELRVVPALSGSIVPASPVLLRVDLNLAQAAFRARRFDTGSVLAQAEAAAALAVLACEARSRFFRGLPGQSSPRERLRRLHPDEPGALTAGRYEIGLAGLGPACRIAFDHGPLFDEKAKEFARELVRGVRKFVAREAQRVRLPLTCAFCQDEEVLARFGSIDFERHPRGRDVHDVPQDGRRYIYRAQLADFDDECDPLLLAAFESELRRDLPPQPLPCAQSQAADRMRFLSHYADLMSSI